MGIRTGPARLSAGLLRSQYCRNPVSEGYAALSYGHGVYGVRTGKKNHRNITQPTACHLPNMIGVFAVRLMRRYMQGHKAFSYE